MQIQYYQNHYTEYESDAIRDYKIRQRSYDLANQESYIPVTNIVSSSTTVSSLFISYQEFYIKRLDALDLFKEYLKWQQIGQSETG